MSAIEDRIRQALDAEVLVSADEVLRAAVTGIRRRRRRQAVAISVATVAAVVLGVVAGNAVSRRTAEPVVPIKKPTPQVAVAPSPLDWASGMATDGTTLYVTTARCPGVLVAGSCSVKDGFFPGSWQYRRIDSPVPLVLWRYTATGWERLGMPGATTAAEMKALSGGLVFVPRARFDYPEGGSAIYQTGPLRVSADGGRTWANWPLPTTDCQPDPTCNVAVAADNVLVTSGKAWFRRSLHGTRWERVSPPKRDPRADWSILLGLEDGTLIASAYNGEQNRGFYRVSRDLGATWSQSHNTPGFSQLDRVEGSTAYAGCLTVVRGVTTGSCGTYWSTDLERWSKSEVWEFVRGRIACTRSIGPNWRSTESAVELGDVLYRIASVPYVNGHEAMRKELGSLDQRHDVHHVLQLSTDGCRSWRPLLD